MNTAVDSLKGTGPLLGSAAAVPELPDNALDKCRVYADRRAYFFENPPLGDIAVVFLRDEKILAELRRLGLQTKLYASGPAAHRKLTGDNLTLLGKTFDDFEAGAEGKNFSLIIIDGGPTKLKFARHVLNHLGAKVQEGGKILVRRYAYWQRNRQVNEMVPALNKFVRKSGSTLDAFILNGDGRPDVVIQVAPPTALAEFGS